MKLLLDIGNQRCKYATYAGQTLKNYPPLDVSVPADTLRAMLLALRDDNSEIDDIWISSVRNQQFNDNLQMTVQDVFQKLPIFAKVEPSVCGCTTEYDSQVLGVDRFLALIGAWLNFNQACTVIDCGTAVTIDVLNAQGVHQGGMIMPGLTMMKQSLYRGTAGLTDRSGTDCLFPKNTADAIDSGCRRLLQASVRLALQDMQLPTDNLYVVTGGDGAWLAQHEPEFVCRESLILEGLAAFSGQRR